jgi:hypothetical protein
MLRPANTSTHSRSTVTGFGTGSALGFPELSTDRVLGSIIRLLLRNSWHAFKILLVALTALFFLFQTECKLTRISGKTNSGACNFVLTKLQAIQPDSSARFSAER